MISKLNSKFLKYPRLNTEYQISQIIRTISLTKKKKKKTFWSTSDLSLVNTSLFANISSTFNFNFPNATCISTIGYKNRERNKGFVVVETLIASIRIDRAEGQTFGHGSRGQNITLSKSWYAAVEACVPPPHLGRFVGDRRGTRGKVQSTKVKLVQICTDCSPNLSRRPVNTDRVSILKYLIAESAMHTWNIYWETGRRRALHDSRPRKDIARSVPLLPRARCEIHSKFLPANSAATLERERERERQTDRQRQRKRERTLVNGNGEKIEGVRDVDRYRRWLETPRVPRTFATFPKID